MAVKHGVSGAAVITTEWIFLTVTACLIVARFYLRLKILHQKIFPSDIIICVAWLSSVVNSSSSIVLNHLGFLNPHVSVTFSGFVGDPDDIQTALKIIWACTYPFFTTFYLCKATILAFYFQIFPAFMQIYRYILWAIVVYTFTCFLVSIFLTTFICYPVQRNWALDASACAASGGFLAFEVGWAIHFSSDILIFIFPFFILPKLNMTRVMRITVYCTFALGIINIAFCLTRYLTIKLSGSIDELSLTVVSLWDCADANVGVMIACLPALRPYIRIIQERMGSSNAATVGTGTGGPDRFDLDTSSRASQRGKMSRLCGVSTGRTDDTAVAGLDEMPNLKGSSQVSRMEMADLSVESSPVDRTDWKGFRHDDGDHAHDDKVDVDRSQPIIMSPISSTKSHDAAGNSDKGGGSDIDIESLNRFTKGDENRE